MKRIYETDGEISITLRIDGAIITFRDRDNPLEKVEIIINEDEKEHLKRRLDGNE